MTNSIMENLGDCRRSFSLRPPPISSRRPRGGRRGQGTPAPLFEPYAEQLPLQSGYYSYVIDDDGRFYVQRGNTTSHAGMVKGAPAIAGGRFRVNRLGRVIEVVCGCSDYGYFPRNSGRQAVHYVIQSFSQHYAFNINPHAVFRVRQSIVESFSLSVAGDELSIQAAEESIQAGEREGADSAAQIAYRAGQIDAFARYTPTAPPSLYSMRLDQSIICIEDPQGDHEDDDAFEYGPPANRFEPTQTVAAGKNNFVLDEHGWLIIGVTGHQILSGGQRVGGAGHVVFDSAGQVSDLELNFSGHYRPDLTAEYARYVYRTFRDHPLITISDACRFAGRKFKGCEAISQVIRFDKNELESDTEDLIWSLESLNFD